jgi:putrescine aminotransferase
MAAASLSGLTPMHPQWDLPLPGFAKVPAPYWYGAKAAGHGEVSEDEFGILVARETEKIILEIGPDRIASFSAEPVQGAGGLIVPPATYWPEMSRILKRHDILLHADEVITGFGRTGEWFGSFTYHLNPDIMTMAKGLSSGYQPISAISLGARMGNVIASAKEELVHGYTYSGHPVASAVALKNLEVLERDGLIARVKNSIGPYFQRRVREIFAGHPLVGEVRGVGLLAAMELVDDKRERRPFPRERNVGTICRDHCFASGLVMRAIRDTMVLAPPLIITEAEIEKLLAKAKTCIDLTARDLGVR